MSCEKSGEEREGNLTRPSSSAMNLINFVQVILCGKLERVESWVAKGSKGIEIGNCSLPPPFPSQNSMSTADLQSLLARPPPLIARKEAQSFLFSSLPSSSSSNPSQLGSILSQLLQSQQTHSQELEQRVKASEERKRELLDRAKDKTSSIRNRTNQLRFENERIKNQAKQVRDELVGKLDQGVDEGGQEGEVTTLRDKLIQLSTRRKQLQGAKKWFAIMVKAEELG